MQFRPSAVSLLVSIFLIATWVPLSRSQYDDDVARFNAQDLLDPPEHGAVLFVGSSQIRRWEALSEQFRDCRLLQRGIGGAHLDHIIHHVDDLVLKHHPRVIVVWAGTNDLAGGDDGQTVSQDFQRFVILVFNAQPDVEILYLGIMPTPGREGNRPQEDIANGLIQRMAQDHPKVHYIDLPLAFEKFSPYSDSDFTSLFVDPIHLNPEGYKFWASVIRNELETVVAPDKVFTLNPQTPKAGSAILFDFGPSNELDGLATISPDVHGNHWNNWHAAEGDKPINAGEHIADLVDTAGSPTGVRLTITGGFRANGMRHGGLKAPDRKQLGDLAVETATVDFFYSSADGLPGGGNDNDGGGFVLDGFNPERTYILDFLGSSDGPEASVTRYTVRGAGVQTVLGQTSSRRISADGKNNGNDSQIFSLKAVKPNEFGQIFVDLTLVSGKFTYLNAMRILVEAK